MHVQPQPDCSPPNLQFDLVIPLMTYTVPAHAAFASLRYPLLDFQDKKLWLLLGIGTPDMTLIAQPSLPWALWSFTISKQRLALFCSTHSLLCASYMFSLLVGILWQVELYNGKGAHQLAAAAEHQSARGQVPGGF